MMPPEILHDLVPPGLPPHDLHLKIGGVYMLLRNMDIQAGLCNGSRFVLLDCNSPFVLKCQLIPANANAQEDEPHLFFLPRINLTPNNQYPYLFNRLQFPCVPAFAITINKSQGGTFDTVGIDLSTHVFSHGQLYVALSRVKSFRSLRILLPRGQKSTMNQVYSEILDGTHRHVPPPVHAPQPNPDGHYYHEDDSGPAPDQEVIDAEPAHPTMYNNWSSDDEAPQTNSPQANDDLPEPQQSHQQAIPLPVLSPAQQGPAPILIDPISVIDSMPYDQRMQFHHALMAHLETTAVPPSTPPRSTSRTSNPPSATPTPTRRNPHRSARRDD